MSKRIYIFDNSTSGLRYNIQWSKFIPDELQSWGYEVQVISGLELNYHKLGYRGNILNSGALITNLGNLLLESNLTEKSIFIFPEARNPMVIYLNELRQMYDLDITIIGWWNDHTFNTDGNIRKQFSRRKRDWTVKVDRALMSAYDYNMCYTDRQYKVLSYNNRHEKNIYKCCLPLSSINGENVDRLLGYDYTKEDRIIINTNFNNRYDPDFIKTLQLLYKDYEFHVVHEQNLTYKEYYQIVRKSKLCINVNQTDTTPWSIYENLVLGAIPILPATELYTHIFSEKQCLFFKKHLMKKPYIKYMRNTEHITEYVKRLLTDYDDMYAQLDIQSIHDAYFNSNDLKQILNELK